MLETLLLLQVTVEFGDKLGELLDTVRMQHSSRFLQLHRAPSSNWQRASLCQAHKQPRL